MERLAIFASGSGTNAREIMRYFSDIGSIKVALLCTDRKDAGALNKAETHDIPTRILSKEEVERGAELVNILQEFKISFIALAGYLKRIPPEVIRAFPQRILNLHPALLPKFGGKGMYGKHVHRAVLNSDASESGISIHLVNEAYDKGEIIFQATCPVEEDDTPDSLADRIHELEHRFYPEVIHRWLKQQNAKLL